MITRSRRGFTIVELLTVMMVVGVLASVAVLKYMDLKHRATSARVAADLDAVRRAGIARFYDTGEWPPAAGSGVVPPALRPYLGTGFSFQHPEYTLEWQNFVPPEGGTSATYQIAIAVTSPNQRLMNTLARLLGGQAPFVMVGGTLVMIVVGPDGRV